MIDDSGVSCADIMAHFARQPGFLLARADQIATALWGEGAAGETIAQAEMLLLAAGMAGAAQVELAEAAGLDTSTTALVLANLATRGWIDRKPDPHDRRRARVALSAAGRAVVAGVGAAYAELQAALIAPVAPADRAGFRAILHRIAANPLAPAPLWRPSGGVPDAAPGFLCRRATQVFQAQLTAATPDRALTSRQFSLLFILTQRPDLSQAGFARMFGLDPSTCSVILRSLARRGAVARQPMAGDARAFVWRITPQGQALFDTARPAVDRAARALLRGEPPEAVRGLTHALATIIHALGHHLRYPGDYPVIPRT
ncbi:MAG: MarR family transcriptional regulator [Sphingomonas fennica]